MGVPTITDVAKRAGVSKKTVSRVLNAEPHVRQTTLEKVNKAINELGFKRSPFGLSLARKRSYLLGLIYDNPSLNFVMHLQTGILRACKTQNMALCLHQCSYKSPNLVDEVAQLIANTMVDGLILPAPVCDDQSLIDMLKSQGIHYVCISPKDTDHQLSVSVNNEQAAFNLTEYLINMGHRDICFIKGHPDLASSAARAAGFERAMKKHDLKLEDTSIIRGMNNFDSGRAAVKQLLERPARPTAIFANNDDMASGVMYETRAHSIDIPKDISIVGFDDSPISQQLWPRLTTVSQPYTEIGRMAASMLIDQSNGKLLNTESAELQSNRVVLDCNLVIRESSQAP